MATQLVHQIRQSYTFATTDHFIERLCSSWLLPTWLLCLFRALLSVYAFFTLLYVIGHRIVTGKLEAAQQSFSYFTVLGYWGLAFYFAFAAIHTVSYAMHGRAYLQSWPNWTKYLHSVFYATVTVYPFIVTAVFWAVLAQHAWDTQFDAWTNISQHAMNSGFAFSEIVLPRSQPHPWINLVPLIVILACYLGLAYLTHATEGIYVYDFLDPAKNGRGSVAGYCIGILAATVVVFVIVRYLQLLRLWLTEKKKVGLTRLASARDEHEAMELDQMHHRSPKATH